MLENDQIEQPLPSGYRDTLRLCCRLALKWMTILWALMIFAALLVPARYRAKDDSILKMVGGALVALVLMWIYGLLGALVVSPLANSLRKRRISR